MVFCRAGEGFERLTAVLPQLAGQEKERGQAAVLKTMCQEAWHTDQSKCAKRPANTGENLYPERDLNPHGPFGPTDFKSVVSTNSTIRAGRLSSKTQEGF